MKATCTNFSVIVLTHQRERRLLIEEIVQIEFTSTLTQEDENRLAPAVLKALSGVLDMLPIAYILRVETTDDSVLVHVSPQPSGWDAVPVGTTDAVRPVFES